jgi:hypothetical protein
MPFLAVVNAAAINMGAGHLYYAWLSVPLGVFSSGISASYDGFVFSVLKNLRTVSIICIPTSSV